jgi:hypothetical protein
MARTTWGDINKTVANLQAPIPGVAGTPGINGGYGDLHLWTDVVLGFFPNAPCRFTHYSRSSEPEAVPWIELLAAR